MATKPRYRAGAIGRTGSGNYGHGLHLAYQGIPEVEFVAVADADETGRKAAQKQTGASNSYADFRDMLAEEKLDIVSVCPRWTDCHLEMVLACIEAGCHIYCEKPLASNLAEGDAMVAAAQSADLKIAVAHQGVYLPGVQRIKQMLSNGDIGDVLSIHARGKEDHRGGGEDMLVLGTHLFNMMRYFVGDVSWMSAHITANGHAITPDDVRLPAESVGPVAGDCVNSYFAFENGVAGFFQSRSNQPGSRQRFGMEIAGTTGRILLREGTAGHVAICHSPIFDPWNQSAAWETQTWDELKDTSLHAGNQLAILDLIEAIEQDREPLSGAADALAALEMILGAYESQITGRRVSIPLEQREHPLERWTEES